jgi:hypothetical protein
MRAVRGSIVSDTSATPEAVEAEPVAVVPVAADPAVPVRKTRAKKDVAVDPAAATAAVPADAAPAEAVPADVPVDSATAEAVPVETVPATTDVEPGTVPEADAASAPAAPAHQVVYVEAPKAFIAKGNRGFGVLIAILSTIIFAVVYAAILVVIELANGGTVDLSYIAQGDFWAPVGTFLVGFVVLVLILNRAGWAAHVLGSLIVGAFVFFVSAGVILLFHLSEIPANQGGAAYEGTLLSVGTIIAGLLGREVALWMGFAVAARGRKVKARNVEARAVYDQEIADKKAEYESGVAPTS